jgi:hypothetical protein
MMFLVCSFVEKEMSDPAFYWFVRWFRASHDEGLLIRCASYVFETAEDLKLAENIFIRLANARVRAALSFIGASSSIQHCGIPVLA